MRERIVYDTNVHVLDTNVLGLTQKSKLVDKNDNNGYVSGYEAYETSRHTFGLLSIFAQ
jgi:hypothetical protein